MGAGSGSYFHVGPKDETRKDTHHVRRVCPVCCAIRVAVGTYVVSQPPHMFPRRTRLVQAGGRVCDERRAIQSQSIRRCGQLWNGLSGGWSCHAGEGRSTRMRGMRAGTLFLFGQRRLCELSCSPPLYGNDDGDGWGVDERPAGRDAQNYVRGAGREQARGSGIRALDRKLLCEWRVSRHLLPLLGHRAFRVIVGTRKDSSGTGGEMPCRAAGTRHAVSLLRAAHSPCRTSFQPSSRRLLAATLPSC